MLALVDVFTTTSNGNLEMFDRSQERQRQFIPVERVRCGARLLLMGSIDGKEMMGVTRKYGANQVAFESRAML